MPGATYRPLGSNPQVEGTMARYDIVCFHTMVGSLWGTDNYFRQGGYSGTESHFGVGYNGEILQWQDTRYRADANLDGVDRVLSVETADMGTGFPAWGGENVPAWTPAQIEANAEIAAWVHVTHGIPLRLIPNTAQSSRGIGWHRQGIDPWRCSTCERWSSSSGKVCPGNRRVEQMPLVVARARVFVGTPLPPPNLTGDEDMQLFRLGTNAYRAQFGDRYVGVPKDQAEIWIRQGVKVLGITAAYDDYLTQTLVTEGPDQFDEPEPPSP
jgi:hypothetical protein